MKSLVIRNLRKFLVPGALALALPLMPTPHKVEAIVHDSSSLSTARDQVAGVLSSSPVGSAIR